MSVMFMAFSFGVDSEIRLITVAHSYQLVSFCINFNNY